MGIALVGSDGRPASRLRCAARRSESLGADRRGSFVVVLRKRFLGQVSSPILATAAYVMPVLLLALQVGYALLHGGRLPHDRLAGTYLVPR